MSAESMKIYSGNHQILGATRTTDGIDFAMEADQDASVSLLLYHKGKKEPVFTIPMDGKYRVGRIFSIRLTGLPPNVTEYNFEVNGKVVQDPCASVLYGRGSFGVAASEKEPHQVRCGWLSQNPFDWEDTDLPTPCWKDMILYKLHVRGYTKQRKGLPASDRGTFRGLQAMIPYWQKLGINAVEMMPAYDFFEFPVEEDETGEMVTIRKNDSKRVNYWGYGDAFYFAPKCAYCAGSDPEHEMKELVKAMHRAGIACVMEFYFPAGMTPYTALNVLHFWRVQYHIDGFHLIGKGVPLELVLKDGLLADTLVMSTDPAPNALCDGKRPPCRTYAEYNSGFLEDMRRFLKSDEGMVERVRYRIERNCDRNGVVNYMVFQDGFTMQDMVSYNYRHNESNGEDNADGSSFNYSWNCGVEGPSRKTAVKNIRTVQVRNAFAMLLLAQGVPMIYAGDEIGNSQKGNNNAWCQDNQVGWTDWKGEEKSQQLLSFVEKLITFRREHPVIHAGNEGAARMYKGKGFPLMSFHGERAWFSNTENESRLLGIMYAGPCVLREDGSEDDYIYIAYNFHWETRTLALPSISDGRQWKKVMDTGDLSTDGFCPDDGNRYEKTLEVAPRTIVILTACEDVTAEKPEEKEEKAKKEPSKKTNRKQKTGKK